MKVTIPKLLKKKHEGQKITMLTCYDYAFSKILNTTPLDAILVGDSLGTVIQGYPSTLPVTVDDIVYHTRAVARGNENALLVADMPFMSYQSSDADALKNAGRLMKEGQAHSVKLEGGEEWATLVRKMTQAGIPVLGHLGIQPQSIHKTGGYKIRGRTAKDEHELLKGALALEKAGAWGLVLEGVIAEVARNITDTLSIPTIGIASGPHCDGQVLVLYDLLGMDKNFQPRFLKKYEDFSQRIQEAVTRYIEDVEKSKYPSPAHSSYRPLRVLSKIQDV